MSLKTNHAFNASKRERWHYFAAKTSSALLRGITWKHHSELFCLNCLHSFAAKNKLETHKKGYENKDFCNIVMSSEDIKTRV